MPSLVGSEMCIRDSINAEYMGSKTKILPFVISGIEEIYLGGGICDLFAGSCSLAGALGNQLPIISNDIQKYSSIVAKAYLTDWNDGEVTLESVTKKGSRLSKQELQESYC
eukprot:TRINITY_DN10162_c0_g1_i1.p3 TRINITY_DN10162_c0_g1~~TRINITY_DN10162_c0_g1_i1.p3  ORF type:complete len:111 (-),score=18.52 TRINITY_DN10162_c0_g1_i1:387-719(-)